MMTLMMKIGQSMLSQEESSEASIGILSKMKTKTRTEVCLQVSSMKPSKSEVQIKSFEKSLAKCKSCDIACPKMLQIKLYKN